MSKYQTINSSAELDYPKVLPTLDLNFAQEKALDPRVTFSRSSGGTYVGSDGLIKIAGVNQPRFEHDPLTGECLGFLYEETRINIGLYSDDFSNWTNDGVTITPNITQSPDGTQNADLVQGISGNRRIYRISVSSSGPVYTYSIFVKKNVGSTIRFDNINIASTNTEFNFDTGILTLQGPTFTSGSVIQYSNGWYRISLTFTSNALSSSLGVYFVNTNDSCYLWGYQFELGLFATSYIPTTTATVTRNGDSAFISGTNFSSWYNKNESSVFIESLNRWNQLPSGHNGAGFGFYTTGGFYGGGWSFSHGRDRHINPLNGYGTDWRSYHPVIVSDGGTFSFTANVYNATTFPIVTSSGTTFYKGLMTLNSSSYTISGDGYLVAGSHSVPLPNATGMSIGLDYNYSAYGALSGIIKRICYWPKNLSYSNIKFITK